VGKRPATMAMLADGNGSKAGGIVVVMLGRGGAVQWWWRAAVGDRC